MKDNREEKKKKRDVDQRESALETENRTDGRRGEEKKDAREAESDAEVSKEERAAMAAAELADSSKEEEACGDEKIEELTDRLKRSLAEFDNYRKRTEKEKSAMFDFGARSVLEKLLPVIDNFERSLSAAPDAPEVKAYADGMEMIYRQLLKNMEEVGVSPMEAVGKTFDPEYHNAVMHVEEEGQKENVVVEEFQKGYMYKDAVLRHSMVKVAN